MQKEKIYDAALYMRLSRDDRDIDGRNKTESNSISGQRDLLRAYVQGHKDLRIFDSYIEMKLGFFIQRKERNIGKTNKSKGLFPGVREVPAFFVRFFKGFGKGGRDGIVTSLRHIKCRGRFWIYGLKLARKSVFGRSGDGMDEEEFRRELRYRMSLSVAKTLLGEEIISEEEYQKIDAMLLQRHRPVLGTLLAGKAEEFKNR